MAVRSIHFEPISIATHSPSSWARRRFAISLEWAAREPLTGGDDKPSLFTAVQEQLGLRLEPATDAVDAFIIDSVEPPTPN